MDDLPVSVQILVVTAGLLAAIGLLRMMPWYFEFSAKKRAELKPRRLQ